MIAPCHFGLEAVLKREIQDLGYEIAQVEDGRVTFRGGMRSRSAEPMSFCVLRREYSLKVGSFQVQ